MIPACCTADRGRCAIPGTGSISTGNCTPFNSNKVPLNFSIENTSQVRWRDEQSATCSQIYNWVASMVKEKSVFNTVMTEITLYIVISLYKKAYYSG